MPNTSWPRYLWTERSRLSTSNGAAYNIYNSSSWPPPTQTDILARLEDMESSTETPPPSNMPRAAKVGHKKSRLGCQRCKTRRVKVSLSALSIRRFANVCSAMKGNRSVGAVKDTLQNASTSMLGLISRRTIALKVLNHADDNRKSRSEHTRVLRPRKNYFLAPSRKRMIQKFQSPRLEG